MARFLGTSLATLGGILVALSLVVLIVLLGGIYYAQDPLTKAVGIPTALLISWALAGQGLTLLVTGLTLCLLKDIAENTEPRRQLRHFRDRDDLDWAA